jgi:uncharacterized hydrophobic protein (TIGR00271 family)
VNVLVEEGIPGARPVVSGYDAACRACKGSAHEIPDPSPLGDRPMSTSPADDLAPLRSRVLALFELVSDQASAESIDASIRAGVDFRGTNLWLLIFATFIASIGLNVNSAAVIIGAMLVSPLMGPIMAIGYGAAVNDFALIRRAWSNLVMAVMFSVLVSTLYFAVTPLSEARSELLARTSPAIWDVLIALFGGLAGIVGVTRKEKSNVIPGVAIATALMPPLCTAGYGIATLQVSYAIGAFYLFSINSVFIATATLIMVRLMRLPEVNVIDVRARYRARNLIVASVVLTAVPSVWLAFGLVRQEVFANRAEQFFALAFPSEDGTFIVDRRVDHASRTLRVMVVGEPVTEERLASMHQTLAAIGLEDVQLVLSQTLREELDVQRLRDEVAGDLRRDSLVALDEKTREIAELKAQLAAVSSREADLAALVPELRANFPEATDIAVGTGAEWREGASHPVLLVTLSMPEALSAEALGKLEAWLRVRTKAEHVRVSVKTPEADSDRANNGR